jgi:actin-related protein
MIHEVLDEYDIPSLLFTLVILSKDVTDYFSDLWQANPWVKRLGYQHPARHQVHWSQPPDTRNAISNTI